MWFRGSWNETISGSAHSDEDVSVFSGNRKEAESWLNDILVAVEKYFDGKSEKFDFIGINKEIAEKIKGVPKRKQSLRLMSLKASVLVVPT